MRSLLEGRMALDTLIGNMISSMEPDVITLPPVGVSIDDMAWKFRDSLDPKPLGECSSPELLEILKALFENIRELQAQLAVKDHAKDALVTLLRDETEKANGINTCEHTVGS